MTADQAPSPGAVETLDELVELLTELRVSAGRPSYTQLAARVSRVREARGDPARPGRVTVYDCFRRGRRRLDARLVSDLVAALGVTPAVQRTWDDALARLGAVVTAGEARVLHPTARLPRPSAPLVGRLRELDGLTTAPPGSVLAVSGIGGAGKSELVLHAAAHLVRRLPRSPALYADARGFDPHRPPLAPDAVLAVLLRQLEVSPARIDAATAAERRDLLRRELAGRSAVVVLENVPDDSYLASVLPDAGRSRVLVTSRRVLAAAGSRSLELGPLAPADALELLAQRVGTERIEAEPEAARRVVELTGGIALDLTVAATGIANRAGWSVADHAHRLAAAPRDEQLRPALLLAYRDLPDDVRRTFRLLGLYPAARVPELAATLLAAHPDLADHLHTLAREHLATLVDDDVVLHDAVAAFARTVLVQEEPFSRQQRAAEALADGYAATTSSVAQDGPLAWLEDQRHALVAVAGLSTAWGTQHATRTLADVAAPLLAERGRLAESEALLRAAVAVGGDQVRRFRRELGRTLELQGRFREAYEELAAGLDRSAPDAERGLNAVGNVLKRLGRLDEAIETYREAEEVAVSRRNEVTRGRAIGNRADTLRYRGDHEAAQPLYEQALAIATAADDQVNRTIVVANMSIAAWDRGELPEALALARRSLELADSSGHGVGRARYLAHLAMLLQETGEVAQAREVRARARAEAERSGQRDVLGELALQRGIAELGGDIPAATAAFLEAIDLSRELANPVHECEALIRLADLDAASGAAGRARTRLADAGRIARSMGLAPEVRRVEERLAGLGPGS